MTLYRVYLNGDFNNLEQTLNRDVFIAFVNFIYEWDFIYYSVIRGRLTRYDGNDRIDSG